MPIVHSVKIIPISLHLFEWQIFFSLTCFMSQVSMVVNGRRGGRLPVAILFTRGL